MALLKPKVFRTKRRIVQLIVRGDLMLGLDNRGATWQVVGSDGQQYWRLYVPPVVSKEDEAGA
jgi:hypothetical protein